MDLQSSEIDLSNLNAQLSSFTGTLVELASDYSDPEALRNEILTCLSTNSVEAKDFVACPVGFNDFVSGSNESVAIGKALAQEGITGGFFPGDVAFGVSFGDSVCALFCDQYFVVG